MTSQSAPLQCIPLFEYSKSEYTDENVLQRLFTASTNPDVKSVDAEIETLLVKGPAGARHVVIKGSNTVHLSLQLMNSDFADKLDHVRDSLLCWTSFASQPDIKLLCVLTTPTLVCIFDIYGQDSIAGGEGHHIFLPCEARSIFSLPTGGFLIQRKGTPEDTIADEEFMLQDHPTLESAPITSLFSVEDALDPALPVTISENHCVDVMEKILWVGEARWLSSNVIETICVSYHAQLERHALWSIQSAPTPPSTRPLWELSANSRVEVVTDTALLEDREDPMYSPHVTRNEALADALGVARRSRPVLSQEGIDIPSNPLHPSMCLHLIYETPRKQSEAEKTFLATSLDGSLPILCMFGNDELHLYTLGISERSAVFVSGITFLSCLSAEPINSFPLPTGKLATDILVVTMDRQLELFFGNLSVASCSLFQKQRIISVDRSVGNRADGVDEHGNALRFSLLGHFDSNTLSEKVLVAIETAFSSVGQLEIARRIRVDCLRIATKLNLSDDAGWEVVSRILALLSATNMTTQAVASSFEFYVPHANDEQSLWERVRNSDFHANYSRHYEVLVSANDDDTLTSRECTFDLDHSIFKLAKVSKIINPSIGKLIFDTMHLLYEESVLYNYLKWQRSIGEFLISFCLVVHDKATMSQFLNHYYDDLGPSFSSAVRPNPFFPPEQVIFRTDMTTFTEPPCLCSSIEQLIKHGLSGLHLDPFFCEKPADILVSDAFEKFRVVRGAFSALFNRSVDYNKRVTQTVKVLVQEGFRDFRSLVDHFPVWISLPLVEALFYCRRVPDVLIQSSGSSQLPVWRLIGREDVKQQVSTGKMENKGNSASTCQCSINQAIDEDHDGIEAIEHEFQMLFPHDNRLHEVGKLLRSSRPTLLKIHRAIEVSDHEFERMKQERLLILCRRVQALPLGRGMFTLGTLEPIPSEPLQVPKLCLSGKVPPNNATLVLDTEVLTCPKNMTVWPEFHNGVAAGLRLPLAWNDGVGKAPLISRAWVVSNRDVARYTQPQRTQSNSQSSNEGREADKQPIHAHGGLLMALGLRGHLSALSMTDIYEYLTQGSVTTSVGILLGMAATKRGSCDPAVSKMLCLHIPSLLPASFASIDVSGPAHTAAVTGIGLLYQGSAHRLMTEFLLNEMGRRPSHDANTSDREAYALSCGLALGMVNLARDDANETLGGGNAGLADLDIELRLARYVLGGINVIGEKHRHDAFDGNIPFSNDGERSSRIHEGDTINNDVTAPGATLALGLMYLKSGNNAVASSLALPDTHFLLEYVRPDFLMLRVIARSMILWDEVEPTIEWINQQIPSAIRESFKQLNEVALKESGIVAVGPDTDMADERTRSDHVVFLEPDIDKNAVRQIHAFVTAGACFGIGLRFAGTGHQAAANAIIDVILAFTALRDGRNPATIALRPELSILEMCLGLCAISVSLVMAGTGDLDTFRHLKILRWKCNEDVKYGNHMSYNASIGLLFLGGGKQTVGQCNGDIAALVVAFFPRFPAKTSDNHYHLQALRHFYALAAKEKIIQTIDIDTGRSVSVPILVQYRDSTALKSMDTPCLLLNSNETVSQIRVMSNYYYSSHIDFDNETRRGTTIFVKKQFEGFVPRNPTVQFSSVLVQNFVREESNKFGSHSIIKWFRQHLGDDQALAHETTEKIMVYAELIRCLQSNSLSPRALWGFRLVKAYYASNNQSDSLINHHEFARLIEKLEGKLKETQKIELLSLSAWFESGNKVYCCDPAVEL